MQRKFLVRVAGTSCRLPISGKKGRSRMTSGFYTTRFVLAEDAAEAGTKAFDAVLRELTEFDLDTAGPPPELTVDEVREDARTYDEFAPGKGFTWF